MFLKIPSHSSLLSSFNLEPSVDNCARSTPWMLYNEMRRKKAGCSLEFDANCTVRLLKPDEHKSNQLERLVTEETRTLVDVQQVGTSIRSPVVDSSLCANLNDGSVVLTIPLRAFFAPSRTETMNAVLVSNF